MNKTRKPRTREPRRIEWTATDLTGDQYLALCERQRRGELRLANIGVGSSCGLWNVQYFGAAHAVSAEARQPQGEPDEEQDGKLTADEMAEGWHWCCEFDSLLVGPGMSELRCCKCLPEGHAAYKTIPPEPEAFYSGPAF